MLSLVFCMELRLPSNRGITIAVGWRSCDLGVNGIWDWGKMEEKEIQQDQSEKRGPGKNNK